MAAFLALAVPAAAAEPVPVRVTGHRVNLRAKADDNAEVVGQVDQGDRLLARSTADEWVEIVPPESVDFWVHRDFVADGVVIVPRLNVRAGPGINYTVVGTVDRGATINARGDFGDWLKIAPVPNGSLWISSEFVEPVKPEKPKAVRPEPPPAPKPVPPPPPAPAPPKPVEPPAPVVRPVPPAPPPPEVRPPPPDLDLIPLRGQGDAVEVEGVLRPAGFVLGRPSRYRLVRFKGHITETICYVRGNERQLETLVGQRLLIRGREYWVQGVRHPVLVPEQIVHRGAGSQQ